MKKSLIFIFALGSSFVYSQNTYFQVRPIALNIGEYKAEKVVKNNCLVLEGEDALKAFYDLLETNEAVRKKWIYELQDENGNTYYIEEAEVLKYYPDLGIVVYTGGHGYTCVDDIYKSGTYCGEPETYTYSPSGRYRISSLHDDGVKYFLEEKINDKYECLDTVFSGEDISGVYWNDDETIHYLKEKVKNDGSKYWIAYSTKFYPVKRR